MAETVRAVTRPLTLRQREVLRLLALGVTWDQAAHRMGIGRTTFSKHRTAALEALDVATPNDAWRVLGWLTVPTS